MPGSRLPMQPLKNSNLIYALVVRLRTKTPFDVLELQAVEAALAWPGKPGKNPLTLLK